jgi:hypothetical protein
MSKTNHQAVFDEGPCDLVVSRREFPINSRVIHCPHRKRPERMAAPAIVVGHWDRMVKIVYESHIAEHGVCAPSIRVSPASLVLAKHWVPA